MIIKKLLMCGLAVVMMAGCAHKNDAGQRARENYARSLADSVANIKYEIDSCNNEIGQLNETVGTWLRDFTAVNNSREVEGYTIRTGWQNRYPLQSTGMIARITESEGLELIASLKGGVFDQITVSAAGNSASTAVVPNDQALNYRREGLTTVMFTGTQADSVAHLIADNILDNVQVTFVNGGRPTGSWKMPADYTKMIADTYELYSSHQRQIKLERHVRVLQEKMKLLREHTDRNAASTDNATSDDNANSDEK